MPVDLEHPAVPKPGRQLEDGVELTGTFTSDKDGSEYEVQGKGGMPKHAVSFTIKFPATAPQSTTTKGALARRDRL